MVVSAEQVRKLRSLTGAGVMDCKQALTEAKGDLTKAGEILKKKGLKIALAKSNRAAREGVVDCYVHTGNHLGVLVEVNCETDFVSRNREFREFVHDLAMHIAAANPKYLSRKDVPKEESKKFTSSEKEEFYRNTCLMDQTFIKDESITIEKLLTSLVAKIGENIVIRRFVRFEVGK